MQSANLDLTVIFPMAGQAAHSGFKYKPFVRLGNETVIEAAVRPFLEFQHRISRFIFVCLQEQDDDFAVRLRMTEMFSGLRREVIVLPAATAGPGQTIAAAGEIGRFAGPTIVCDCDHSIDVKPLFERIDREPAIDCSFPIWSLRGEDLRSWSIASCDKDWRVTAVAEKKLPDATGEFVGVIGCHYFNRIEWVLQAIKKHRLSYLSEVISEGLRDGLRIEGVPIQHAEFFGDTKGIRRAMTRRDQFVGTILCDLDGTLTEHEDQPCYDVPIRPLPGSSERVREWMDDGYMVVFTTARHPKEQPQLEASLRAAHLPYHQLLMGLPSGPRYLINDRKPSAILFPQVASYEVSRNEGVVHINLPKAAPTVLRRFKGASLADTLLIEDDEKLFVRKRVLKRDQLSLGYAKLKNQFRTLERFASFGSIVPTLYGDHENTLEYYFDMEYLTHHHALSALNPAELKQALSELLAFFRTRVYAVRMSTQHAGGDWLQTHLTRKVFPKLDGIANYASLSRVVESAELVLDDVRCQGLRTLLARVVDAPLAEIFSPKWLSAIHGDLTFENVLYHAGDVRVIDMDGGDFLDAPELDLGKMFQSLVARYEEWAHSEGALCEHTANNRFRMQRQLSEADPSIIEHCLQLWSDTLECTTQVAYRRALFYMGLHLIRMLPFRLRVSEEQALHALLLATKWINIAIDENEA